MLLLSTVGEAVAMAHFILVRSLSTPALRVHGSSRSTGRAETPSWDSAAVRQRPASPVGHRPAKTSDAASGSNTAGKRLTTMGRRKEAQCPGRKR